ncbi:MAG TPA: GMC family oxidoreductase [Gallionellaceae bacterium]|nr:GMC family oxidoreductase [Gallionellaceae bacterium]
MGKHMHKHAAAQGLTVTQAADVKEKSIHLKADAVVVGSGAGGAVAAYELAKTGKRVIVLEAGRYLTSDKFPEMLAVSMGLLYQDHGMQSNADGDIAMLQGACVGGSTVVNASVCFRIPDHYLEKWGKEFGLTNLSPAVMHPYFERVERNLHITACGSNETSPGAELIKKGFAREGLPEGVAKRNMRDCALTGFCFAGCATDRKQSMLVTYLPWAQAHGAKIYADTHVVKVLAENGKAAGVQAEIIDPDTGKKMADLQVDAPIVVLAAGAVQTPLLLLKSGLANSSGQVGKNFACHPTLSLVGEFPETVDDFHGATHSLFMDRDILPPKPGYLLLNAIQDPVEASIQVGPKTGKPYLDYMIRYRNTVRLICLVHDKNKGEIRLENGNKVVDYNVDDEDFEIMKVGLKTTARVLFGGGANKVRIPASSDLTIASIAEVDKVIDGLKNERKRYRYVSFHPQGSCRMGADPKKSVVNAMGETHDVKNLYIADASLMPTSTGYNTQESVYALSSYVSDRINEAHRT